MNLTKYHAGDSVNWYNHLIEQFDFSEAEDINNL